MRFSSAGEQHVQSIMEDTMVCAVVFARNFTIPRSKKSDIEKLAKNGYLIALS